MPSIFLNYRRDESAGHAGRLFDELEEHFGKGCVFFDVSGKIEPGEPFHKAIERAVDSCDVMLAVIGQHWVTSTNKSGSRRIDDPFDFVRLEISKALQRNLRVIPILIQHASMPLSEELPQDLQALTEYQAVELTDTRWKFDVSQLIASLEKIIRKPKSRPIPKWVIAMSIGVLMIVVSFVVWKVLQNGNQALKISNTHLDTSTNVNSMKSDTSTDEPYTASYSHVPDSSTRGDTIAINKQPTNKNDKAAGQPQIEIGKKETEKNETAPDSKPKNTPTDKKAVNKTETITKEPAEKKDTSTNDKGKSPSEEATELYRKGVKEYSSGNLNAALTSFQNAIKLNPQNSKYYYKISQIYRDWGLQELKANQGLLSRHSTQFFTKAIENLSSALRFETRPSKNIDFYFLTRGEIKLTIKDKAGACLDFQAAANSGMPAAKDFYTKNCQ